MADEFLRFLEGYIKAEKVKSYAIHGNFWEKRLEKKNENFVVVALEREKIKWQ